MRRLDPPAPGSMFGRLTIVGQDETKPGNFCRCVCACGTRKSVAVKNLLSGHTQSCGCYNKQRLSETHTGHKYHVGKPSPRFQDLTGRTYGKLTVIERSERPGQTSWICSCSCGRKTTVHGSNLRSGKSTKCRKCGGRALDITGERVGLLVAVSNQVVDGSNPIWTFKCKCGNTIKGTVRDFHLGGLRSCGCYANAKMSWASMMSRCYKSTDPRYSSYGGRGIKVCKRWHKFEKFLEDIGERPKRHNLSRKNAEKGYSPSNCFWEHISKNCRDTSNTGEPTKAGLSKGAKPRSVQNSLTVEDKRARGEILRLLKTGEKTYAQLQNDTGRGYNRIRRVIKGLKSEGLVTSKMGKKRGKPQEFLYIAESRAIEELIDVR